MRTASVAAIALGACTTADEPLVGQSVHVGEGVSAEAPTQFEEGARRMTFDHAFIEEMIEHHKKEIDLAQVAESRGEHAEIRAFAVSTMATDNQQIDQLEAWRRGWFGSEGALSAVMPKRETEEIAGAKTVEETTRKDVAVLRKTEPFDQPYLDAALALDRSEVQMAKDALEKAQQSELHAFAAAVVKNSEAEIAMLQELRDAWYPNEQAMGETPP